MMAEITRIHALRKSTRLLASNEHRRGAAIKLPRSPASRHVGMVVGGIAAKCIMGRAAAAARPIWHLPLACPSMSGGKICAAAKRVAHRLNASM